MKIGDTVVAKRRLVDADGELLAKRGELGVIEGVVKDMLFVAFVNTDDAWIVVTSDDIRVVESTTTCT